MNAGPGRPSGGGGRSRRRRGRRPNNARGARPAGPSQSRHNQDGIYTAPMDHSYRAALAGNGNNGQGARRGPRPGFAAPFAPADPEPLPALREDSTSRIFAFVDDLFFAAKIQETARKLNVKVEFAKNDKDLAERMLQNGEEKPSLIIFDSQQRQRQTADAHSKIEEQAQERNLDHRIPFSRAGRSQAEGARSGMRHGAAPLGLLPEPAPVAAPARSPGRRESDRAVGTARAATERTSQLARRKLREKPWARQLPVELSIADDPLPAADPVRPDPFCS